MRAGSPVRQLLIAYVGLWAVLDLVAALPGSNPGFTSMRGLVASVFIQCLVVWRLSRGSSLAWGFGLFMALGSVVSLVLMDAFPIRVAEAIFVAVCVGQAGVLLAPPIRALVRSRRHTPSAAA